MKPKVNNHDEIVADPNDPAGSAEAAAAAPSVAGEQSANAVDTPPPAPNLWAENGALIVARGSETTGKGKRCVIVVETREVDEKTGEGTSVLDASAYPAKADIVVRDSVDLPVPDGATALTMGVELKQGGMMGLSAKRGFVHVGPASRVYAALNVAYIEGARDVKIIGLTDAERAHLKPWFDQVADEFTSLEYGG